MLETADDTTVHLIPRINSWVFGQDVGVGANPQIA
jgi:hypothetical protein